MKYRIEMTQQAGIDLRGIYEYIAIDESHLKSPDVLYFVYILIVCLLK